MTLGHCCNTGCVRQGSCPILQSVCWNSSSDVSAKPLVGNADGTSIVHLIDGGFLVSALLLDIIFRPHSRLLERPC